MIAESSMPAFSACVPGARNGFGIASEIPSPSSTWRNRPPALLADGQPAVHVDFGTVLPTRS